MPTAGRCSAGSGRSKTPPERLFLTHGEPESSLAFAAELRKTLGWQVSVPQYREVAELDGEE